MKEIIVYITAVSPFGNTGQNTFEKQFIRQFIKSHKSDVNYDPYVFYPVKKTKYIHNNTNKHEKQFIQNGKSKLDYLVAQINFIKIFFYFLIRNRNKKINVLIRYHETMISPLVLSYFFNFKMVIRTGPVLPNLFVYKKNPSRLLYNLIRFSLGDYYRKSKKIITVTKTIKNWVKKTYNVDEDKIIIIPNGVNTKLFFPEKVKKNDIHLNKRLILGYVGYIYEDSGLDTILDAFGLLSKKGISLPKLIVVGGGDYIKTLKIKEKKLGLLDCIEWVGPVNQKKVSEYIYKCDIMLAPFPERVFKITGSSSLKLYEYLACNKPILASNAQDHLFIQKNNLGILIEPDNPVLWSIEIENLKNKIKNLSKKGFEFVKANHSLTKQVNSYVSVLIN